MFMRDFISFGVLFVSLFFSIATAQRFSVDGDTIYFSTLYAADAPGINWDDVTEFDNLLRANPAIKNVVLESEGGDLYAGLEIGRMFIDFAVDTKVTVFCESACAYAFLGGQNRILGRGGRLGFHRSWWAPENMRSYYESEKSYYGWKTPFDFSSWVVEDTQNDTYMIMSMMLERGVDAAFAVETLKAEPSDMWYPYPKQLRTANVVTE